MSIWYKQTIFISSWGEWPPVKNIHSILNNVLLDNNIKSHVHSSIQIQRYGWDNSTCPIFHAPILLYPKNIPYTPKWWRWGYMYSQMKKSCGHARPLVGTCDFMFLFSRIVWRNGGGRRRWWHVCCSIHKMKYQREITFWLNMSASCVIVIIQ